jgi:transcriptional regulator with PAS, ATPase and Fis domain
MQNNFLETTENIELLARFDFLDLCLLGETGTGKTHTARLIHSLSPRAKKPFVAVNCAELTPSIIEAELFGFEKGSFTGALSSNKGKFELASSGTLFLDEIGELPQNLQAKFLKVVEEKCITRVGGNRPRQLDVRIIYATHRDLNVLREDLRYRISAHAIYLKPLRERPEEIIKLAKFFLSQFSRKCGHNVTANDKTLKVLELHDWNGNIRELRSFIEKVCIKSLFAAENKDQYSGTITLSRKFLEDQISDLEITKQKTSTGLPFIAQGEKMDDYLERIEANLLRQAMVANNNNQTQAARELGISRGGLIKKLKRLSH